MTKGWAKTTNCILLPMISMVSILPCLLLLLVLHLPNLLLHKNMFSKYFTLVALCGLSYHLINLPTSLARCLILDHSSLSHHICTSALHFISFSARLGLLFMTIVRLVSLNKKNFDTKREKLVFLLVVPARELERLWPGARLWGWREASCKASNVPWPWRGLLGVAP